MKQIRYFLMAIISLMSLNISAGNKTLNPETLPQSAKAFIAENYKGQKILSVEKDWNSYDCILSNCTKIEFTKKGVWEEVEHNLTDIIVPKAIRDYVKANYPNTTIQKIEKERYGYDIELSNDVGMRFNKQGTFIRMKD